MMPSVPNVPCIIWNTSWCSLSGVQIRTSPVAAITSYSRQVSWNPPWTNDIDSIEQPATAPPIVIVLSSGTTIGTRPCGSVAATRSTNVTPDSATQIRRTGSISRISVRSPTSILSSRCRRSCGLGTWCETDALRSDTGRPGGSSRSWRAIRATLSRWRSAGSGIVALT